MFLATRWNFGRISYFDWVHADVTFDGHVSRTTEEEIRSTEQLRVLLVLHSIALECRYGQLPHLQRTRQTQFSCALLRQCEFPRIFATSQKYGEINTILHKTTDALNEIAFLNTEVVLLCDFISLLHLRMPCTNAIIILRTGLEATTS